MPRDLIIVKEKLTLEQSLELFSKKTFNFRKKYYNIRLTGKYSPEIIRQFVYLPFEIEIYDFLKIDRIVTGTENSAAEEKYLYKRVYRAERHLHTHPPEGKIIYDTPSFNDYQVAVDGPKHMIIAHIDGMILFGHPEFDITGKKIIDYQPDDAEYMLDDYLSEKKLSWRKKVVIGLFIL